MTLRFPKPAFKQSVKSIKNIKCLFIQLIILLTKMTTVPLEIMFICQAVGDIIKHSIVHRSEHLTFSYPDAKKKKNRPVAPQ